MRSADAATLFRVMLIVIVAYLILLKASPVVIILLIAIAMAMDAFDGYLAVNESSNGKVGLRLYLKSILGDEESRSVVKSYKGKRTKASRFGPRMDIAGDRAVEYILWIVYTYVNVIPLFVIFIVVLRHSFVDAVMAEKGTSSKMKTKLAQIVYSSNLWRGGINVVKFATFSYLSLVYIWGYPAVIGYALVAILVIYILVRGAAEIIEAYA